MNTSRLVSDTPEVAMTATKPDAELIDVVKTFPDGTTAVDGVSLAVAPGEFFSLLGPSGCGKSTTLRILAGLEEPTSGNVLIRGEDMRTRPAHKRPTNMVFQRLALFPHLTVTRNVAFGPRLSGTPRRDIEAAVQGMLELVDLSGYGHRYPHELSGGQQQRVAIARALINQPAVLLLDEPLGALDLRLRIQLQHALKEIQQRSGTTFIYVTHDQTEAMTMSNRVAVMNAGRIEQVGPPETLYTTPATRFVATFIGDTNLFEGHWSDAGLDTGDLVVRAARPGNVACVRPERVLVATRLDPPPGNVYEGVVTDCAFQGSTVRYTVRLDSGRSLLAEHPADGRQPRLSVGETAQIGFDPASMVTVDQSPV